MIDSTTSSHIWLPKIVEAGNRGFSSEPSGAVIVWALAACALVAAVAARPGAAP